MDSTRGATVSLAGALLVFLGFRLLGERGSGEDEDGGELEGLGGGGGRGRGSRGRDDRGAPREGGGRVDGQQERYGIPHEQEQAIYHAGGTVGFYGSATYAHYAQHGQPPLQHDAQPPVVNYYG
jgi:hypothetical protein